MDEATALLQAITRICRAWTALQLACSHGLAGRDSQAKAEWFPSAVTDWLLQNKSIEQHEIEDGLFQMMAQEFDVIAEDGSLKEVSRMMFHFLQTINKSRFDQYEKLLSELPDHTSVLESEKQERNSDCESGDDEEPEIKIKEPKPEPVVDEDGFEMVSTGKKGRKSKKLEAQIQKQMELLQDDLQQPTQPSGEPSVQMED